MNVPQILNISISSCSRAKRCHVFLIKKRMSLLEDIFLEDEAGEAQDLERIIEGDEYDERPRSRSDSNEDSEKEDEAGK